MKISRIRERMPSLSGCGREWFPMKLGPGSIDPHRIFTWLTFRPTQFAVVLAWLFLLSANNDVRATSPPDIRNVCVLGTGNYGLDITVCTGAIRATQDDTITLGALYLARGRAFRLKGECARAIEDFTEAEVLMPFSAAAVARRAVAHRCLGNFPNALTDFNQSLALNPFFPAAWRDRGITNFFAGRLEEARRDLTRAIEIDAYDAEAHTFIALCHFVQGDFDLAVDVFDRAYALGHAWQYLPLWRLLTRQYGGSVTESFHSRMLRRAKETQWPAPLLSRYMGIEQNRSVVQSAAPGDIQIYDQRRTVEADFYHALRDLYDQDHAVARARLEKLSVLELNPPSAEISLARLLLQSEHTFISKQDGDTQ